MTRLLRWTLFCLLLLLIVPAFALATGEAVPVQPRTLILPGDQLWTLLIGGIVPLVTYGINKAGPWLSEPVKAMVLVLASAIAGALYTALAAGGLGWNGKTLQLVLSAVVGALLAHKLLWLPSGISVALGGGQNRQTVARVRRG